MEEQQITSQTMPNNTPQKFSWDDFVNFKTMILPSIIKLLYFITTIAEELLLFLSMKGVLVKSESSIYPENNINGFALIIFVFGLILIPLLNHIFFEIIMLPFAMLKLLKEIRDKLAK